MLLATDRAAYGRLARLLTLGKSRAPKGECRLTFDDLATYQEGLLVCVFGESSHAPTVRELSAYRETFGDRAYLLAEAHHGPDDEAWLRRLYEPRPAIAITVSGRRGCVLSRPRASAFA